MQHQARRFRPFFKAVQRISADRMLDALNMEPDAEPKKILENVKNNIAEFVGEAEQFDDLTMLCIVYNGKKSN